ncbi:MAG: hypothetical protein J3K34DRAFT_420898 [Monoraphidium minutum]|nr:MAG: hypothetical protein J3K34DRAFT_420898 [Monoraphidium minutum]
MGRRAAPPRAAAAGLALPNVWPCTLAVLLRLYRSRIHSLFCCMFVTLVFFTPASGAPALPVRCPRHAPSRASAAPPTFPILFRSWVRSLRATTLHAEAA